MSSSLISSASCVVALRKRLLTIHYSMIFLVIFSTSSCRMPDNFGFYQPITLSLEVPDGPPEFKAGWYAGCKSVMGVKLFQNGFVYNDGKRKPDIGSGVYQHDPVYQSAFGIAFYACREHIIEFVGQNAMKNLPLQ